MNRNKLIVSAILIVTSIIFGAFGAHALKEVLPEEKLVSFETGVRYQMYVGITLLVFAMNWQKLDFSMKWVWALQLMGGLLFSCSIYLLALQGLIGINLGFLGPITPIGGTLLIAGWIVLIYNLLSHKQQ